MAKVFRIHDTGTSQSDWFSSAKIGHAMISEIQAQDTRGNVLPTSVPSPFARMDLVRNAFSVVTRDNIDGATDSHKLISDTFDIGQILFNYDKHKSSLKIIAWNYKSDLIELINSSNSKHKHLGETLKLFLDQDTEKFNFDKTESIFMLEYNGVIIGGTSPRTLFFASPKSHEINVNIRFGGDTMLDDDYLSLYKRESNYVKYIYALSKTENFHNNFPEVYEYLIKNLDSLKNCNAPLWQEIADTIPGYLDGLPNLTMPDNSGVPISVLTNFNLKQAINNPVNIGLSSDFVIKATKNQSTTQLPLVLPQYAFTNIWQYTTDKWDSTIEVPEKDPRALSDRKLPAQDDVYPYLIADDFFSETIVKLPAKIDSEKYYVAGKCGDFLLPIKEEYFKYFTVNDLMRNIRIEERAGNSVKVSLSIATKAGDIEFTRLYHESSGSIESSYSIKEMSLTLGLFPFVKNTSNANPVDYTVVIADGTKSSKLQLKTINSIANNDSALLDGVFRMQSDNKLMFNTESYNFRRGFDAIALCYESSISILIPKFEDPGGGNIFQFGIDFGTTNTHIAVQENEKKPVNFEINKQDQQLAMLYRKTEALAEFDAGRQIIDMLDYIQQETIPEIFSKNGDYEFPFRSCILENKTTDHTNLPKLYGQVNIGFDFEKKTILNYLDNKTDLKWASFKTGVEADANKHRVRLYVRELLRLCKNKVLLNQGVLKHTKIFWSYPTSMEAYRIKDIREIWVEEFEQEFDGVLASALVEVPESLAPYYYATNEMGISTYERPTVSLDIGGGTSDIAIFDNGKTQLITSFKFAGNSIFGDGFNGNVNTNGFISTFHPEMKEKIGGSSSYMQLSNNSTDIISYFFSLQKNKNFDVDFGKMLADNKNYKIVFLLFYSSVAYHIAQVFKAKNLKIPRTLILSGTASKSLKILDNGKNFPFITALVSSIFKDVLGVTENLDLDIIIASEPKEITAKGLLYDTGVSQAEILKLKEILPGDNSNKMIEQNSPINNLKYAEIENDELIKQGVMDNVIEFHKLFNKLSTQLNFKGETGMTAVSFELYEKIYKKDLNHFLVQGMKDAIKESEDKNSTIEETLFFYCLKGLIPKLAFDISQKTK